MEAKVTFFLNNIITVNPFNFAASKFCVFKGSKFYCFKVSVFLVVLICYNDEQIYSRILIFAF